MTCLMFVGRGILTIYIDGLVWCVTIDCGVVVITSDVWGLAPISVRLMIVANCLLLVRRLNSCKPIPDRHITIALSITPIPDLILFWSIMGFCHCQILSTNDGLQQFQICNLYYLRRWGEI